MISELVCWLNYRAGNLQYHIYIIQTSSNPRLHDNLIDQLPVLTHLKKWLAQLSISPPPPAKPTLIMELVPQVLHNYTTG